MQEEEDNQGPTDIIKAGETGITTDPQVGLRQE
jgi:hypothetical protein